MSWIENVNSGISIRTGDGRTFFPEWINATKAKEFNISEFEFIDVAGTLVSRGTPKGRKYNIEIFFQGENHLEDAQEFDESSDDPRAWTIQHPFYGEFQAQPISLFFDNKDYNVTKITGPILETIADNNPKITVDPTDKITLDKSNLDTIFEESFSADIPSPSVSIKAKMGANLTSIYEQGVKSVSDTGDFENYFNAFNEANSAISDIIGVPLDAIRKIQAVINAPIYFVDSVKNRLRILATQFDQVRTSLANLLTREDKKLYENNLGVMVSAMALCSVTDHSYSNRGEVLTSVDLVIGYYNAYLSDLDSIQSENAGSPDSYVPDVASIIALSDLVNYTVANLFLIAIDSKQERVVFLEDDTNLINLTHRFYGLDANDENLVRFINDNEVGLNEMLIVKKDRRIVYYV